MQTKVIAKIKLIIVLVLILSPIKIDVNIAKEIIPTAKPTSLPGHNNSLNAINEYLVATI